jgi:hypothetical protein
MNGALSWNRVSGTDSPQPTQSTPRLASSSA